MSQKCSGEGVGSRRPKQRLRKTREHAFCDDARVCVVFRVRPFSNGVCGAAYYYLHRGRSNPIAHRQRPMDDGV